MLVHVSSTASGKSSALAIFATFKKGKGDKSEIHLKGIEKGLSQMIHESFEHKEFGAKACETLVLRNPGHEFYRKVIVVGLGDKADSETIRRVGSALCREIEATSSYDVDVQWTSLSAGKNRDDWAQSLTEGLVLTSYKFNELKSGKKEDKKWNVTILADGKAEESALKKSVHKASTVAECVNFARRLGDMPANMMTPTILGETVQAAAKGTGLKVQVWDKKQIEKEKMGCFLGVSQGSAQPPRFIAMEYHGAGKGKKPIAFVGKAVTFDSGGISLKPSAAMEDMKYDMMGGAAVLGTMLAIAKLKLKVNAIAYVPACENLPGPTATKPGDVHTARNGKTVEINNTDAEGRLILCDALSYACDQDPAIIIDAATLTGAMTIALGDTHVGYFVNNDKIKKSLEDAAEAAGEKVWNLPLVTEHVKDMRGQYGDLSNMSYNKGAGSAKGAAFLHEFISKDIPWAHFDIASMAYHCPRLPYAPKKGASGVILRTFVKFAENFKG